MNLSVKYVEISGVLISESTNNFYIYEESKTNNVNDTRMLILVEDIHLPDTTSQKKLAKLEEPIITMQMERVIARFFDACIVNVSYDCCFLQSVEIQQLLKEIAEFWNRYSLLSRRK